MVDDIGGQIHGIGLDSFLQMAQMEQTTCTLKVLKDDNVGYLYLLNGDLIDAETEKLKGIEAAYAIIGWEKAVIEIENVCEKKNNVINQSIVNILMEAVKSGDKAKFKEKEQQSEIPEVTDLEIQIEPTVSEQVQADAVQVKAPETIKVPPEKLELEIEAPEPKAPQPEATEPEALKPEVPEPVAPQPKAPAPEITRKTVPSDQIIVEVDRELMEEASKSKKKILTISAAVIAAAVIASIVVVYFITTHGDKGEYRSVLAKVENQPELEERTKILQNFTVSHDQSQYTASAEKKIKEIQNLIEERDFNNTRRDVKQLSLDKNFQKEATSIYNRYLTKYPKGIHSAEVRQKISEIPQQMDDMDYQKVKEAELSDDDKKIAAYSMYLANHPQGKHYETVENLISEMSEEYYTYLKKEIYLCDKQEQWDDCIQFCNSFMITFKNNKRFDEISDLKNKLEGKRDLAALRNKAELKGADYEAAQEIYLTYLKTNPDSSINSQIKNELAMIDKKIQEKRNWETIAAYSQNQQKDIFDRVQRLKKYMEHNPSEQYLKDAEKTMKQLQTEKAAVLRKRQAEEEQSRYQARLLRENERIQKEKERAKKEKEKIIVQFKQLGGRFVANSDGTVDDSRTNLKWCMIDSHLELNQCLDYESATNYVKGLQTGGYRDWRLPTASELAGIYKSKPFFPTSGAKWYWTSEVYAKGYHKVANIVTSTKEEVFKKEYKDVKQCGAVRAVRP